MLKEKKSAKIHLNIIYIILIIINFIIQSMTIPVILNNMLESGDTSNNDIFQKPIINPKLANNDTAAPIVEFVQPPMNNTLITQTTFEIIVNISDDNPPQPGNVTIQISDETSFLFNASMNKTSGIQWSFNWLNISQYPNRKTYILQVWAKDSSLNGNNQWSGAFYVFINTSIGKGPPLIIIFLLFIPFAFILAAIIYFLNRKAPYRISRRKRRMN